MGLHAIEWVIRLWTAGLLRLCGWMTQPFSFNTESPEIYSGSCWSCLCWKAEDGRF